MTKRDILAELDLAIEETYTENKSVDTLLEEKYNTIKEETSHSIHYKYETIVIENHKKKKNKFGATLIFATKYSITCAFIFGVLLLGTNYSAYYNIAKSYIFKDQIQKQEQSILNSVEAASLKKKVEEKVVEEKEEEQKEGVRSITKYKRDLDSKGLNLDIEITPYENRILIPKIGKNIPLVDVKNRTIEGKHELENIFMKELENGVVRYPGSALPGEEGTTFVFGHSSNFPWMSGDYNDIFATLDNVAYGDEIIVYYNQKKYKYVIREKKVIRPGDVSVLKRNNKKNELSIMTCWPIGTTLNRLIVTGELVEE